MSIGIQCRVTWRQFLILVPFTDESAVARRFEIQPKKGNWAVVERDTYAQ